MAIAFALQDLELSIISASLALSIVMLTALVTANASLAMSSPPLPYPVSVKITVSRTRLRTHWANVCATMGITTKEINVFLKLPAKMVWSIMVLAVSAPLGNTLTP
jgi:hypothetical protein